ncbi:MAG TPA: tetraacyldisaccharide 4'-kinase [Caldimonas sp.]|jgi:tetraacyldisaccharide 4'-kinase|nr:tetraacyldisaccharide 4'-kinase [Caldimonas sp.]HEX4235915.1 tetraacyldisaccharide 4'-kinase [Caldimonas sp.]
MPSPARATLRERLATALQRSWQEDGVASTLLLPAAWAFEAAAGLRRKLFERGIRTSAKLPVPVVVVGNVVVGGAGKTPTVIAVVSLLVRHGYMPGIVSRGYGRDGEDIVVVDADASADRVGDEPLLLRRRTGVPIAVGADRVAAGHALLRAHPEVDVVVSDDGLQHLALERDVEILVFDERGAGNGRLLPAGPLRERPPHALAAHRLVVYNADAATTPLPGHVARRDLAGVTPLADWWAGALPDRTSLAALRGRAIVAAAGIARPGRFFALLRSHGLEVVELPLGDHADFQSLPWPIGTSEVVVTEKDAVKLAPARPLGARVWVAPLDFALDPAFDAALLALLPPPTANHRHGNTAS